MAVYIQATENNSKHTTLAQKAGFIPAFLLFKNLSLTLHPYKPQKQYNKVAKLKLNDDITQLIVQAIENGCTDKQAYSSVGISRTQFYKWQNDFPFFADAIKNAKRERTNRINKEIVHSAEIGLISLIKGCEYDETTTETGIDPKTGKQVSKTKTVHKKVLPNPTAVIFALCNRMPQLWQNKVTGEIKQDIQQTNYNDIDISRVSDATLDKLIKELEQNQPIEEDKM